nr:DUF4880 domain-containing protein [Sphingobium vermicomposti]
MARVQSEPTPQDEAELLAWIEADPRHAVAFAKAEAAWDAAERLKCVAADIQLSSPAAVVDTKPRSRPSRNWLIALALPLTLFIIAALIIFYSVGAADL